MFCFTSFMWCQWPFQFSQPSVTECDGRRGWDLRIESVWGHLKSSGFRQIYWIESVWMSSSGWFDVAVVMCVWSDICVWRWRWMRLSCTDRDAAEACRDQILTHSERVISLLHICASHPLRHAHVRRHTSTIHTLSSEMHHLKTASLQCK